MQREWKCCGCGVVCLDLVRRCDCPTNVLFAFDEKGDMVHEIKIAGPVEREALSRLRQAIIDNTTGDMFWIRDILLSVLEDETGFNGEAKN